MTNPEKGANLAALTLLVAKAKARQVEMAAARGDTLTWT